MRTSAAGSMAMSLYFSRISRKGFDLVGVAVRRSTGHIRDARTAPRVLFCATMIASAAAPSRQTLTHSLEPRITSKATIYWL